MMNHSCYSGPLAEYRYPSYLEFRGLLSFLKQINSKHRIHLTDIMYWDMPYPDSDFDVYIICAFGEFINEEFINHIDSNPKFADKHLILLTSQLYEPHNLLKFKVFYIEHMHTIVDFFKPAPYSKLVARQHTHSLLSRRNALHKSLVLNHLLKRYPNAEYTLANLETTEFKIQTVQQDAQLVLGLNISDSVADEIIKLHQNTKTVSGHQWSIDNNLYKNTKLNWAVESIFLTRQNCPTAYLTEKIIKPITSGSCFVLVSQMHSYQRLRLLGFETFENKFQIDFDHESDQIRLDSIFQLIDLKNFDDILNDPEIQHLVDYNYHYFFNDFFNNVESTNQSKIENLLDYINGI
jgi:hypothetical protein